MSSFLINLLYWSIERYVHLTLNTFFRDISVVGKLNIPQEGPVIIAGNHPNMIMDALLIGTTSGRRVHFWVKSSAFQGLLGKFMRMLGAVPVMRKQDLMDKNSNDQTKLDNSALYDESYELLREGACFVIFPEGTSYTEPHIKPFKTGIARLAIGLMKEYNIRCPIICAGINYTRKDKFRSQVLIQYNEAIFVDEEIVNASEDGVMTLTKQIEQDLKSITINTPDWETMKLVNTCRNIYTTELRNNLDLQTSIRFSRTFSMFYERFHDSDEMKALRKELEQYQAELDDFNVQDEYFVTRMKKRQTSSLIALRLFRLMFFMLVAFPGIVLHSPIYLLARVANKMTPYQESRAMLKLIVIFFTMPLFYIVLLLAIWWFFGTTPMLEFSIVLPIIGFLHIYCLEKGVASGRNILSLIRLLGLSFISSKHTDRILHLRAQISQRLHKMAQEHKQELEQAEIPILDGPQKLNAKRRLRSFLRDSEDQLFI